MGILGRSSLILFLCATLSFARIIHVPAQYNSIQGAINEATDGDTVLVQPGTYRENINFKFKKIVVSSLFLLTGEAWYIPWTVIDRAGVRFESGEDSATVLTGFTISRSYGNGISCHDSSPSLSNLIIADNDVAGIYCGGNSNPSVMDVTISGNSNAGIYCEDNSCPSLINITISGNWGSGIYCRENSTPYLANVTISGNSANEGGGIHCRDNSSLIFDNQARCNIYLNQATRGNDLYNGSENVISVVLDTFTIMQPTDYYASPIDNFTFDILNVKIEQVAVDLYVSPTGDNENNGLSFSEPLKNIHYALSKIAADSTDPHIIHLANGQYSPSTNGEYFPLYMQSYVSISGESRDGVILDAEYQGSVIKCDNVHDLFLEKITITGGSTDRPYQGGGIYCYNSSPSLDNIIINKNSAWHGGGIYCENNSNLSLSNVTIHSNTANGSGGGILCKDNSSLNLSNVTIHNNSAKSYGGGIFCYNSTPRLSKVSIHNNAAENWGGGICCYNSNLLFDNENRCNIYLNNATLGKDLFNEGENVISVVVDTFTIMNPINDYVYPIERFTFDILNAKVEQVEADLYVSPAGNNNNSGLSFSEPLQNINYAFSKIIADSINPRTIYLANGRYSPSTNGELIPINMLSYVSLSGESQDSVILDAEGEGFVIECYNLQDIALKNMTIRGGSSGFRWYGGGIYCENSSPSLINLNITDNWGSGINCYNSSPVLTNVTIKHNISDGYGGGIYCGSSSNMSLYNVTISNNSAESGGGIYCDYNSNLFFGNQNRCNIYLNDAYQGRDLYNENSEIICVVVDTFTVLNPTEEHAYPIETFTFNILHAKEPTSHFESDKPIPNKYALSQNYPNPFNPVTVISWQLPVGSEVDISLYNILGQKVAILVSESQPAGFYQVEWNAGGFASGIYYYRLTAGEFLATRKLVLLR